MSNTFKFEGVKIGQTDDGERVYLDVEVRRIQKSAQTTDHEMVEEYYELSISGHVIAKHARNAYAVGQIQSEVRSIGTPVKTLYSGDIEAIYRIWGRWHLNGMRALCAHQTAVWEDTRYGLRMDLEAIGTCPESGYRPGSAWLVEELDWDDMMTLQDTMERAVKAQGRI